MMRHLNFPLALFLFCAAPAAAGWMWQPYTGKGPPGTYVVAVPVDPSLDFPVKDQERVPLTPRPVTTTAYRLDAPPQKASLAELVTAPWPCDRIRKAIEVFGREVVRRYAKARGYTKKQINEAMACVPEKRT